MKETNRNSETTDCRLQRAAKLLRDEGWTVRSPSSRTPSDTRDQCEFPDLLGEPGDCCTRLTSRNRKTKFGTMWLCDDHFAAPLSQLFDPRV